MNAPWLKCGASIDFTKRLYPQFSECLLLRWNLSTDKPHFGQFWLFLTLASPFSIASAFFLESRYPGFSPASIRRKNAFESVPLSISRFVASERERPWSLDDPSWAVVARSESQTLDLPMLLFPKRLSHRLMHRYRRLFRQCTSCLSKIRTWDLLTFGL